MLSYLYIWFFPLRFDFIPVKIIITVIFITISITSVIIALELKKLNQHYKSIKILRRELK
ncbi:hypothetical protein AL492_17945 [Elizabethkingia anophelis]|nr:hypothetical protein AL491_15540 [Elizabethkingia anophelis]AVF53400.1 hypothetical protein AL492_17945 [Elizabethkingia anophelis]